MIDSNPAMQVVFVDFDGVLNAESDAVDDSVELWTASWLDAAMVERLSRFVESAAASVVISSSWRCRRSIGELAAILAERGYGGGIVDVTPRHDRPPEGERLVRAGEIAAWLAGHPEVASFVILDDDEDFGPLASRHVRTDPAVGLTDADVARARAILAAPIDLVGGKALVLAERIEVLPAGGQPDELDG